VADVPQRQKLALCTFVSDFAHRDAFSHTGRSNSSDVLNDVKFRIFAIPVKIRGEGARSPCQ